MDDNSSDYSFPVQVIEGNISNADVIFRDHPCDVAHSLMTGSCVVNEFPRLLELSNVLCGSRPIADE